MRYVVPLVLFALTGCGPKECVVSDPSTCPAEQTCEQVTGREKPLCFAPVTMGGRVYRLADNTPIEGAEVLATNADGAPVSTPAVTDAEGAYRVRVPTRRADEKGTLEANAVILRAQAKDFRSFPSGARVSLPVSTAAATREGEGGPWLVKTEQTNIGLDAVDASAVGLPTVTGKLELSAPQPPALVALEASGAAGRTTLARPDGTFTFFNVPAGTWRASGFARGVNYTGVDVTVASADVADVTLLKSSTTPASLSGSISLVAGANGAGTSVVLALESTFIEALGRGEVPPGLRAPENGEAPNIKGAWTISGIPDGKYVVLAAFENDDNVRDPDPNIAGTGVQRLTVSNGQLSGATSPAFKVTAAVAITSPGRDGLDETTATPTFAWQKHPNADAYTLDVFDGLGNKVWTLAITDGNATSATYAGPALAAGGFYQWRLTAIRRLAPTSHTEELRGVFRVR